MDGLLETAGKLDPVYEVILSSNLTVHVRPFIYSDRIKMLRVVFEQEKIKNELANSSSPEDTLKLVGRSIQDMSILNSQLIVNSVFRLHDDSNGLDLLVNESNRKEVIELMKNLDLDDVSKIEDKVKLINNIGIEKKVQVKCSKCNHEWESEFETNPVNFSLGS
jgi:hypothetical protein